MSGSGEVSVHHPRRVLVRSVFRTAVRAGMKLFTRAVISGAENFPAQGPVILAANHISNEPLMLMAYTPWHVDVMVADDIPVRPRYMIPLYWCYGIVPIKRGSIDRTGLTMALDILKQGGAVGIFPQGGIWNTMEAQAYPGVAWLSYKARAPVLPIGFGGMREVSESFSRFQRPQMIMNVGELIPPVDITGRKRKVALQESADHIMQSIADLVPEQEKQYWPQDEDFDFELIVCDSKGRAVKIPDRLLITFGRALGQFFHRPVLLKTLAENLALPVQALRRLDREIEPSQVANAAQAILDYLQDNSQFLGYRFGYKMAQAMQTGIAQLRNVAMWAAKRGYRLRIRPIRRYRRWGSKMDVVEETPRLG